MTKSFSRADLPYIKVGQTIEDSRTGQQLDVCLVTSKTTCLIVEGINSSGHSDRWVINIVNKRHFKV